MKLLVALGIATLAGLIDTLPMIRMNVPRFSIAYVFAQWVIIGTLIPYVSWSLSPWLKGLIIGELGMIPIMIIAFSRNPKRIPGIILFAAILGIGISVSNDWLT